MLSSKPELIWQGRMHLGDEPGVFGDAHYSGLATEIPITLEKISPQGSNRTTLVVTARNVATFAGYPGHLITVTAYLPSAGQPDHFTERVLATARLAGADQNRKEIPINLTNLPSTIFASVRVRVDTEVPPGLYDDFVLTQLLNRSENFAVVASLGFRP
jgi:hypothetical protein